jgi:hypothetical protein
MPTKSRVKAWSVGGQQMVDKVRKDTPPEIAEKIREQAHDKAIADVYGADWKEHVGPDGKPQEQGVGSTLWLLRVSEEEAEIHYAAISRWRGPAAAQAERERIARLKSKK